MARVTSVDLAQALGISQSTVSRALSNDVRVARKTRQRVKDLAQQLGYTPNAMARSLSTRQSNLIGIVISEMTSPFYPFVLEKLTHRLHKLGWRVLLFTTDADHEVDELLPLVLEYQCDGLIIASASLSSHMAETLRVRGTPVVLFNRYVKEASTSAVCCDNFGGGRLVAQKLLAQHQHFAYIAGRENTSTNRDREQGYSQTLQEAKKTVLLEVGNFTYESGFAAMQRLLRRSDPPDAVFCANDITAIGAIDAARQRGVLVGQDVSVVGFDDIPMAAWSAYNLSTVRQPVIQMIDSSLQLLFEAIEHNTMGSNLRFLPGEFIERGSTKKPKVKRSGKHG
ncbi:MAG: LacI family DNA-binding transcriptional regulator [Deinococcales bacterium]